VVVSPLLPLADLFDLNTKLFRNAITDLNEVDAATRPNGQTNSAAFIAGHLVETRAWMGRYVGLDQPPPFGGILEHVTSLDQVETVPELAEIRAEWDRVSERVSARLRSLEEAEVAAPSSQRFPGVGGTVLGGIAFLIQHESYHVGQLGYLRKYFGLPPMSYR